MEKIIIRKIKEYLRYHHKSHNDYAKCLGIELQALRNKYFKQFFTAKDLLKLCKMCNGRLALICEDGNIIYVDDKEEKDGTTVSVDSMA